MQIHCSRKDDNNGLQLTKLTAGFRMYGWRAARFICFLAYFKSETVLIGKVVLHVFIE